MNPSRPTDPAPGPSRILFRHGESVCNAGGTSTSSASIPLSPRGREAARRAAIDYEGPPPDLIIVSPYLRAAETARPFIERFPAARVECWPVHEFTFLNEARYTNTTSAERRPATEAYWNRSDAGHVDGPGAESFAAFLDRIGDTLRRLRALPEKNVLVFTHETAIKAAMWLDALGEVTASSDSMRRFREFILSFDVPNVGNWTLPERPMEGPNPLDPAPEDSMPVGAAIA